MNELTKHKISISMRGKRKLATHKRKISEALKGRNLSKEHKEKISKTMNEVWKKRKRK